MVEKGSRNFGSPFADPKAPMKRSQSVPCTPRARPRPLRLQQPQHSGSKESMLAKRAVSLLGEVEQPKHAALQDGLRCVGGRGTYTFGLTTLEHLKGLRCVIESPPETPQSC